MDLQEIVRTTYGHRSPTPGLYVTVEDAKKLIDEIKQLRDEISDWKEQCQELEKASLEDEQQIQALKSQIVSGENKYGRN